MTAAVCPSKQLGRRAGENYIYCIFLMQQTDMVLLSQKPDSFGLAWSLNDYCVAMPFNAMGNIGKISGQERGGELFARSKQGQGGICLISKKK